LVKKILIAISLIPVFIVLFFVVAFLMNFLGEPEDVKYVSKNMVENTKIDLSLNSILFDDWDKTIFEIAKQYQGGKISLSNIKNGLSSYSVDVQVTDINRAAKLIFIQNDNYISNRIESEGSANIRKISFDVSSKKDHEREFKSLKGLVSENFYSQPNEELNNLIVISPDKTKKVSINWKMDIRLGCIDLLINLIDRKAGSKRDAV
jgi:hypothetical protein